MFEEKSRGAVTLHYAHLTYDDDVLESFQFSFAMKYDIYTDTV
jgi:hypothetical protein